MRSWAPAFFLLTSACAQPTLAPGEGASVYTLPDWSQTSSAPAQGEAPAATATSTSAFRAALPQGYRRSEATLSQPITALFLKELHEGEAAIIVERYLEGEADKTAFIANLAPRPGAAYAAKRVAGGGKIEVYEGIEFESLERRIPPVDPYAESLGAAHAPPRLSFLERRRFPVGGEAYRLYRCRKEGVWGVLRKYRRARADPEALYAFKSRALGSTERKLLSACLGRGALLAMETGGEPPDIPKPTMYRLRIMARDEWAYGASRLVEREAVHLRDFPGGFYALRLRAPRDAFTREYPAFLSFAAGFEAIAE